MGATEPPPRIAVDTLYGFDIGSVDLRRIDILVFPFAVETIMEMASRVIVQASHARLIAFIGLDEQVSKPDKIALLEQLGPEPDGPLAGPRADNNSRVLAV
jgi:hypothetical protein